MHFEKPGGFLNSGPVQGTRYPVCKRWTSSTWYKRNARPGIQSAPAGGYAPRINSAPGCWCLVCLFSLFSLVECRALPSGVCRSGSRFLALARRSIARRCNGSYLLWLYLLWQAKLAAMLYLLWQAKLRDALEPGEYAAHASRDRSRERARDLTAHTPTKLQKIRLSPGDLQRTAP